MSVNSENQAICYLAAFTGQKRPVYDPAIIAMNCSKLYRIAVSLQNRGVHKELIDRARALAKELDLIFEVEEDLEKGLSATKIFLRFNPLSRVRLV